MVMSQIAGNISVANFLVTKYCLTSLQKLFGLHVLQDCTVPSAITENLVIEVVNTLLCVHFLVHFSMSFHCYITESHCLLVLAIIVSVLTNNITLTFTITFINGRINTLYVYLR